MRPKAMKPEQNIRLEFHNTEFVSDLLYMTPKAHGTEAKIDKQGYISPNMINSQKAHEKNLNISNHQKNANQNYNVMILPHTHQDGYYQKTRK